MSLASIVADGSNTVKPDFRGYLAAQEICSVKDPDYAAVGDGVANDTAALNLAFAVPGRFCYLPKGTYKVTANLAEPVCSGIIGEGMNQSIISAAAGVTKVLSLGSECTTHRGYQVLGNATAAAIGIVLGDAESGGYAFEDVFVKNFTGTGAYGWKIKQALKSTLIKCTGQGNFTNYLIDGTGTAGFPTTLELIGCGNIDATDVGMLIIQAETVRIIGGFSDSNAKEAIKLIPAASGTIVDFIAMFHRFEDNYNSSAADYQFVANGDAAGSTIRWTLYKPIFTAASVAKSIYSSGSANTYELWQPQVATNADIVIRNGSFGIRSGASNVDPSVAVDDNTGFDFSIARGQIKFPATQAASADGNVLDDYEEGNFPSSPIFVVGSGSITSYTTQRGTYTKVGRKVFVQGVVHTNAVVGPGGSLKIGNLPYAASANSKGTAEVWGINLTASQALVGQVDAGAATITISKLNAVAAGDQVANNMLINFSATYEV